MSVRVEDLQKRLIDLGIDGVGIYGMNKAVDMLKEATYKYTVVNLKQYTDGAIKVGVSLIDLFIPQVKQLPYVGDWLGLLGRIGVSDALKVIIDKPTFCYAKDENTIICYNFDTTVVSVKIDGSTVTPTISGTAEELTLSLPSPLSTGKHDLVVVGNKVSWAGKIVV
jgi:hypothetical protein